MTKLLLTLFLVLSATLFSQTNIQLHYDLSKNRQFFTSTIEYFKPDSKGSLFYFVDMNYNASGPTEAYFEIARQLRFWEAPISLQLEYNGGLHSDNLKSFQINNAYLLGAVYNRHSPDFQKGFSIAALYKHIQGNIEPHNFQFTMVGYWHLFNGKISLNGFADFWREKNPFLNTNFVFLSEPQCWVNINPRFSVGGEVEIGYHFGGQKGWSVCPTLAVRYKL